MAHESGESVKSLGITEGNRAYISVLTPEDWKYLLDPEVTDFSLKDVIGRVRSTETAAGFTRSNKEDSKAISPDWLKIIIDRTTDIDKLNELNDRLTILEDQATQLLNENNEYANNPHMELVENNDFEESYHYLNSVLEGINEARETIAQKKALAESA